MRVLGQLLLIVLGLVSAYWAADVLSQDQVFPILNFVAPAIMGLACAWTSVRMVGVAPALIWTPMPALLVTYSIYFGIGALTFFIGSPETVDNLHYLTYIDEYLLLRINTLNAAGIALVIAGYLLGLVCSERRQGVPSDESAQQMRQAVVALRGFSLIGLPIKWLLIMPHQLGQSTAVLPGLLSSLSVLSLLGIVPAVWLVRHGYRAYWGPLIFLWLSELLAAILLLSKQQILLVMIVTIFSDYLFRPSKTKLILWCAGIAFAWPSLVGFVAYGRERSTDRTAASGSLGASAPMQAASAVRDYMIEAEDENPVQGMLARLSYAGTQAFAIVEYDKGIPGDSFDIILYTLIPRVLWPNKPIMTLGADFNQLAYGTQGASGPGGFVTEAYWNGGWTYVVIVCAVLGVLFQAWGSFSLQAMARNDLLYLPVVFMGLVMGLRPDDWFVATFVGTPVMAFAFYFVTKYLFMPMFDSSRARAA